MRRIKSSLALALWMGWVVPGLCAQDLPNPSAADPSPKPNPIEVYFTTLSGLRYIGEEELLSDRDLQTRMAALGDPEVLELIRKSKNSSQWGFWGLGTGLAALAGGLIAATDNTRDDQNVLTGAGVALGGLCLTTAGALLTAEGNSTKFNAVQRYNRVVSGWDQPSPESPSASREVKLQPISVKLTTLGGFGYSVQGKELSWPKDFEDHINGLHDFEATRLLEKSKSSGFLSQVLLGIAVGGEVAAIALNSGSGAGGDKIGFWIPFIGSLLVGETGSYVQMEANTAKFNAVKRYNRFASGQEQVLPPGPKDDQSLMEFNNLDPLKK